MSTVIFSENFDAGVPGNFTADYDGVGTPNVTTASGGLRLSDGATGDLTFVTNQTFGDGPYDSTFTVQGQLGVSGNAGGSSASIVIGNRAFGFFPGFGGGAFRVYQSDGTTLVSNTNMGFDPAQNILHDWTIDVDTVTSTFDITVVDGNNSSNVFNYSYAATGFATGGVGFAHFHGSGTTLADNLLIFADLPAPLTPEPGSLALMGVALVGVGGWYWRYKRA